MSTSSCLPNLVKWFIIFRMRSTYVMNTLVYPLRKRWLTPRRHCSKVSPSAWRMVSANWLIAELASVSSEAVLMVSMRNSNGGFSRIMGK